jgi:5-methylcytosine-specific restriction endonuclease McrA
VYLSKRWRKLRRLVLDEEPYCQQGDCQAPSAEVDHVIRIEVGGHPWDRANLMAMCGPHHSAKTAAETGFGGRHD